MSLEQKEIFLQQRIYNLNLDTQSYEDVWRLYNLVIDLTFVYKDKFHSLIDQLVTKLQQDSE